MTPKQVARTKGTDEAAVESLLAQDGFRELVAAHEEFLAEPPEAAMARLVRLARLALENALSVDWDVGAALFVLREHKRGRDTAETIAKGVVAASRRASRGTTFPPLPAQPAATPPTCERPYEPDRRLIERGAARVRQTVVEEHAIRHAAAKGAMAEPVAPPPGVIATVAAARKALAMKASAARRLAGGTASAARGELGPRPAKPGLPRRRRPP